ncbi:MAG: DUF4835 family protein [Bacteroidaceae bacterium]|nr:DUF4835 family protein [Bacteroidaceae bacterium]
MGWMLMATATAAAQELNAKVSINRQQVSNTKGEVFDALQEKVQRLLNETKWTDIEMRENERIQCSFAITVSAYSAETNVFECSLLLSSQRPVWGSTYTSVGYSVKDPDFQFVFQEADELVFRPEQIDNNLVAMLAYYAYLLIGIDMDTMAPMGGTAILQRAEDVVTAGQSLDYPGWKAFDGGSNRFALLNDYLDGRMEPMRQFQYQYHRKGLDRMTESPDSARAAIAESLDLLLQAHKAKNLTKVAQLFTEYKREELLSIFSNKATSDERRRAYDVLFNIDPSKSETWDKLKK